MSIGLRYTFGDLVKAAQALDDIERMKAELAEFAAQHLPEQDDAEPGVVNFLDILTGDAFDTPPEQAIEYFRGKRLRASFSYADTLGKANDAAFTVAKMMDVDLLSQVRASLDSALANGTSFTEWKRELIPVLKSAGWWGEAALRDPLTGEMVQAQLGSPWRLETIFRTNMQAAYAAGAWQEIQDQAELAPFLMYDAVDDFRTRPLHASWDSRVLPITSAWWRTHYPPNGYNCRCGVIQLSADDLAAMGITPQPAPEDGAYTWTNPRTGETLQVPNGIDPGFDRRPGADFTDQLREILEEKVALLPEPMAAAIAPVLRREFDTTTAAGKWHAPSFDDAPDWIRNRVLSQQAVSVETKSKSGAWARLGSLIDMDGEKLDTATGQSVWRHEFGHIMDARLASGALYRSSQADFVDAQKTDADALAAAAGNGRKSKANDARRAAIVQAYEDVPTRMLNTDHDAREGVLRDMATVAGLDFDQFLTVVRESTTILDGGVSVYGIGNAVRIARMIEAVRLGDGEGFLRWASLRDTIDAELRAGQVSREARVASSQSWRKDGSLASLSDLIGSATRNRAANYHDGFPGHSNAYYRKASFYPPTESFANLTALAGHPNRYWWEITRRFAPNMADLFRGIIEGQP